MESSIYDAKFKTREIGDKIPFLKFDNDWEIKIIPPFGGASSRFLVKCKNATVSIYSDFFNNLGYMNNPYWEVYPYNGDVFRCSIDNTEALLNAIRESIKEQNA